ncbi:MAG: hypothetical protein QG675_659 [Patescibacteria group bacterium]|jgi:LCP family protein required for cell wall assembly|nr:hypothetical protein [Patescibacteria group bacterium]
MNTTTLSPNNDLSPIKKPKRIWLRVLLIVIFILLIVGALVGYKIYRSYDKVLVKNMGSSAVGLKNDAVEPDKLKGEGDGRINILLLGVGDSGHAGEQLSDTMIVASYDPATKDTAMLSIPRDMYVKIPGYGLSKINGAHAYGEQYQEGSGPELAKKTVSEFLGIPIHYYLRTDFSALKQAVDLVGGVDVQVAQNLTDAEYPCERNENISCGFSIMAGQQHFNGSVALKYARCRKGDCGDDYGRAQRQQDILVALREKADAQNILTNPIKINELLNIVGNNVRTDLAAWEIERLSKILKEIDPNLINSKVIDNKTTQLVTDTNIGGASVVVPLLGVGNYRDIQAYVRTIFADGYIKKEAATITLLNGTKSPNLTNLVSTELKSYNYNIVTSGPADTTTVKATQIIDYSGGKKPYTISLLEKRLGVKATVAQIDPSTPPPTDIQIIIGADYKTS